MAESPTRAGPTLLTAANTSQTIYTAGGVSTWAILRSIIVANETDLTIKVSIGIGTSNTDAVGKRIVRQYEIPPNRAIDVLEGKFIPLLGSGTPDLLYAVCDTANGATVTVGHVSGP